MSTKSAGGNEASHTAGALHGSSESTLRKTGIRSTRSGYLFNLILISFLACALFAAALIAAYALPVQDLAQYWAAAHLVAKNPYSAQLVTGFEISHGIPANSVHLVTKIPPWAIMLVLPLSLLNYQVSFAVWSVMSITVIAGCARATWTLFSSRPSLAPALISLLFGPTVVLLMLGQFTVLVLLGITLFLVLTRQRRDVLAGASLLLVVGKPHIALIFLIAVILWTVRFRRWSILVSGAIALSAACIAAFSINHRIFAQFLERTGLVVNETESYPNLGGMLFSASGHHILALLPQCIGVVWLLVYWRKHGSDWDWKTNGMTVLLVSVTCSYYSYPYDEILMLPPLISAFLTGDRRLFLAGFLATNLGYVLYISNFAGHYGFGYMSLWWTASAWLITYVLAFKGRRLPDPMLNQRSQVL